MIGESIRDVVVIHSLIHNLLVLLCNSPTEVEEIDWRKEYVMWRLFIA